MLEAIMNNLSLVWVGVMVVFLIVEAATAGLTCIWFAIGALAALIAALFGMLFGKYPRKLFCVSSFVAVGGFIAQLLYKVIEKTFVAQNEIALLVMLGIAGLMFVVSLIFLAAAVRREDRDEELLMRAGYEI